MSDTNKDGVDDVLFWCHVVSQCSIPVKDTLSQTEKDALYRAIVALHTTTTLYTRMTSEMQFQ